MVGGIIDQVAMGAGAAAAAIMFALNGEGAWKDAWIVAVSRPGPFRHLWPRRLRKRGGKETVLFCYTGTSPEKWILIFVTLIYVYPILFIPWRRLQKPFGVVVCAVLLLGVRRFIS